MNGKLIMMTMAGILNTMIGIATAASAVLLLNSWKFLFVGALFVRGGHGQLSTRPSTAGGSHRDDRSLPGRS